MIKRTNVWMHKGYAHTSFERAKDAAESDVHEYLKKVLLPKGFTANEVFKVAQAITENRAAFASLLDYPDIDDRDIDESR